MHQNKPEILNHIKTHGPVLPKDILRFVNNNLIFASAMLSELVSDGEICLTFAKIGGSPLYYAKGQEPKLQGIYPHLSAPLKKAFDLLKTKKILRDKICEPWQRVALRELRDFAVRLDVTCNAMQEVFWKWYLISEEDATKLIKEILIGKQEKTSSKKKEVEKKASTEIIPVKEESKKELVPIKKWTEKLKDDFYSKVKKYFENNNIKIISEKVVKKNKEVDFVAEVPSQLGLLRFYIKAKNKNKINNNDLNLAYHYGRTKEMHVIFLTAGELTANAKILLDKELKGLIFKKV